MKKITLLLLAFLTAGFTFAQVTITHNNSQAIVPALGLTCQNGGITTDNKFYGTFDLANDFAITTDWEVQAVEFGVDDVLNAPGNAYPVGINIYTTSNTLPTGTLTLLGGGSTTISSADAQTVVSATLPAGIVVPAGEVMIVELVVLNDGVTGFRLGATDVASNDDSWIQAPDCGLTTPGTYASLGFADRWHVMNVVGDVALSVGENIASLVSVYPNPAVEVINVKVPASVVINEVVLYDILGKNTGVSYANGQVNVSALSRGVYMLSVKTSEGTLTKKIVKK